MKTVVVILLVLFSIPMKTFAWDAPEVLEGVCDEGCTPKMQAMYNEFLNHPYVPVFIPGMYSGECNHLSSSLDPDTTHYIGLLLNNSSNGPYMAPVLQFFGDENSMKDWSLEDALKEMSPDWILGGKITTHKTSMTAAVLSEGLPRMVYWARQNPASKEIYFMAWLSGYSYAFCTLTPNVGGLSQ